MKKRRHYIPGYAAIIASVFAVAAAGRVFTGDNLDWYDTLTLPTLAPPGVVIGLAWSFIYICTAAAALIAYTKADRETRIKLMIAFAINGALNVLWTVVFFGLHDFTLAVVEIIALELSILWIIAHTVRTSKLAMALLVPYAAWVAFATYLTIELWRLNA